MRNRCQHRHSSSSAFLGGRELATIQNYDERQMLKDYHYERWKRLSCTRFAMAANAARLRDVLRNQLWLDAAGAAD